MRREAALERRESSGLQSLINKVWFKTSSKGRAWHTRDAIGNFMRNQLWFDECGERHHSEVLRIWTPRRAFGDDPDDLDEPDPLPPPEAALNATREMEEAVEAAAAEAKAMAKEERQGEKSSRRDRGAIMRKLQEAFTAVIAQPLWNPVVEEPPSGADVDAADEAVEALLAMKAEREANAKWRTRAKTMSRPSPAGLVFFSTPSQTETSCDSSHDTSRSTSEESAEELSEETSETIPEDTTEGVKEGASNERIPGDTRGENISKKKKKKGRKKECKFEGEEETFVIEKKERRRPSACHQWKEKARRFCEMERVTVEELDRRPNQTHWGRVFIGRCVVPTPYRFGALHILLEEPDEDDFTLDDSTIEMTTQEAEAEGAIGAEIEVRVDARADAKAEARAKQTKDKEKEREKISKDSDKGMEGARLKAKGRRRTRVIGVRIYAAKPPDAQLRRWWIRGESLRSGLLAELALVPPVEKTHRRRDCQWIAGCVTGSCVWGVPPEALTRGCRILIRNPMTAWTADSEPSLRVHDVRDIVIVRPNDRSFPRLTKCVWPSSSEVMRPFSYAYSRKYTLPRGALSKYTAGAKPRPNGCLRECENACMCHAPLWAAPWNPPYLPTRPSERQATESTPIRLRPRPPKRDRNRDRQRAMEERRRAIQDETLATIRSLDSAILRLTENPSSGRGEGYGRGYYGSSDSLDSRRRREDPSLISATPISGSGATRAMEAARLHAAWDDEEVVVLWRKLEAEMRELCGPVGKPPPDRSEKDTFQGLVTKEDWVWEGSRRFLWRKFHASNFAFCQALMQDPTDEAVRSRQALAAYAFDQQLASRKADGSDAFTRRNAR